MRARWWVRAIAFLALAAPSEPAEAFPAVYVGKDDAARIAHTTHVVVLRNRDVSVVTLMADYEGPLAPFALLVPVPSDVTAARLRTVKRGLLSRLEALTAPRFHTFYEQDPCETGAVEQRWDEHVRARGRGFLTPEGVPPLDGRYSVSNEISAPVEPVFKRAENEFRYETLEARDPAALRDWLAARGYRLRDASLSALTPHLGPERKLLFAEVDPRHVELGAADRVELGGIRYWTRRPLGALPATLGLPHSAGIQDLFVYVLDREQRFHVTNYANRFLPTNLTVEALPSDRVAPLYNALFDAARARDAFVTEYAWSTAGCGQPCPDAPLGLDELMSLGADVIEAQAPARAASAEDAAETASELARFDRTLSELPASERAKARRDHAENQRELARRRALSRRHTYVVSRLHHRYDRASLPRDVELGPAPFPMRGGVGVPKGATAELARAAERAERDELQVRFVALKRFTGPVSCAEPLRFRWGKPWPSEARAARAVSLAVNLSIAPRGAGALDLLVPPVPELGARPRAAPAASTPRPAPPKPETRDACSAAGPRPRTARDVHGWPFVLISMFVAVGRRRVRKALSAFGSIWLACGCAGPRPVPATPEAPAGAAAATPSTGATLADSVAAARSALARNDARLARDLLNAALERARSEKRELTDEFTDALLALARAQHALRDLDAARRTLHDALALLEQRGAATSELAALAHHEFAAIEVSQKNIDRARAHMTLALGIRERRTSLDDLAIAHSLNELASLSVTTGDFEQAAGLANRGIALLRAGSPERDRRLAELHVTLAEAHRYRRDLAGAERPFVVAVELLAQASVPDTKFLVDVLQRLAATRRDLGRDTDAVEPIERMLASKDPIEGSGLTTLAVLIDAERALGRPDAADARARRYAFVDRSRSSEEGVGEGGAVTPATAAQDPGAPTGDSRSNAARVLAGMSGAFRECYQAALQRDRDLRGHVKLTIRVGASGEVERTRALSVGLPVDTVDCVLDAAAARRFDPPDGGSATINVPVTFVKH